MTTPPATKPPNSLRLPKLSHTHREIVAWFVPGKKLNVRRRFQANAERMRYAELADTHTIGSACVESAVHRVINLRIKSLGIFWLEQKAETMIVLRAKPLYGRGQHFWATGSIAAKRACEQTAPPCAT